LIYDFDFRFKSEITDLQLLALTSDEC